MTGLLSWGLCIQSPVSRWKNSAVQVTLQSPPGVRLKLDFIWNHMLARLTPFPYLASPTQVQISPESMLDKSFASEPLPQTLPLGNPSWPKAGPPYPIYTQLTWSLCVRSDGDMPLPCFFILLTCLETSVLWYNIHPGSWFPTLYGTHN